MLLPYDSDMLNKSKNYTKSYIQVNCTKFLFNNQRLNFNKFKFLLKI